MASIIGQYVAKEYTLGKQLGSRSWEIRHADSEQREKLKLFFKPSVAMQDSLELIERIRRPQGVNDAHPNIAELYQVIDTGKHVLVRSELCEAGDFNSLLIDFRYRSKVDHEEQVIQWIFQLLEAINYLDKNLIIHKKINTYNLYMQSDGRLKLDGFEHAVKIDSEKQCVKVDAEDKYSMYNSPELVKYGAINRKYHIWSLGCLVYEMTTCEWQHFKLLNETFEKWTPPSFPNYSKSLIRLYKKMLRLSPRMRPPVKNLKVYTVTVHEQHQESEGRKQGSSSNLSYLKQLVQRFERRVVKEDEEILSDNEEDLHEPTENDLEFVQVEKEKNKVFKGQSSYKLKEKLDGQYGSFFQDLMVMEVETRKKKLMRQITYQRKDSAIEAVDTLKVLFERLRSTSGSYSPYLANYQEAFIHADLVLCYVDQFYEDGSLEKEIRRHVEQRRHFQEEKAFDFTYYLLDAVNFMHDRSVLHKCIIPANVMIVNDRVKLTNFGIEPFLAKSFESLSNPMQSTYLSPETIKAKKFFPSTDVWAIGCIMYEMCMQKPAFIGKDLLHSSHFQIPDIDASPKIKSLFKSFVTSPVDQREARRFLQKFDECIKSEKTMLEGYERP